MEKTIWINGYQWLYDSDSRSLTDPFSGATTKVSALTENERKQVNNQINYVNR